MGRILITRCNITKKLTLGFMLAALFFVAFLPILWMFGASFVVKERPSLEAYKELFLLKNLALLGNSLLFAFLATSFATLLGVPIGFLLGKSDLPVKTLYRTAFLVPLIVPSYIYGLAWADLLGRTGAINRVLASLFPIGDEGISNLIYSTSGAATVLGFSLFPIMMLISEGVFSRIDPHLEESGLVFGRRGLVLRDIILPLATPGILSGMLIVFILSLSEFAIPFLLRVNVFTTQIFTQFSAFYNEKAATALSLPIVTITLILLLLERFFFYHWSVESLGRPSYREAYTFPLGRLKACFLFLMSIVLAVGVVFPLVYLILESSPPSVYRKAFLLAKGSIVNSLVFGAIGASLLTFAGLLLGYFSQRPPFKGKVDFFIMLPFALPATVLGVGLIKLWNRPESFFNIVYGSLVIIILGYLARFFPIASRLMANFYGQIAHSIEEAAEVAGASWPRIMTRILIPLLTQGIIVVWLLSFIFCIGELGTTILVYPPGKETLPIMLFTVMANSPANIVAALAVILVVMTLMPVGLFYIVLVSLKRCMR